MLGDYGTFLAWQYLPKITGSSVLQYNLTTFIVVVAACLKLHQNALLLHYTVSQKNVQYLVCYNFDTLNGM